MILSPNNNKKYREIVEVVFNWEMGMGPTSTMFTAYGSWDAQMGMGWWDMPMVFQWSGDEVRGLKKNISIWFAFRILVRFAYSGIYIILVSAVHTTCYPNIWNISWFNKCISMLLDMFSSTLTDIMLHMFHLQRHAALFWSRVVSPKRSELSWLEHRLRRCSSTGGSCCLPRPKGEFECWSGKLVSPTFRVVPNSGGFLLKKGVPNPFLSEFPGG